MKIIQAIKEAFLALEKDGYLGNLVFYVGVMMGALELFVVSLIIYCYFFNAERFSNSISIVTKNWSEHLSVVVAAVILMWLGKRFNKRIKHEKV